MKLFFGSAAKHETQKPLSYTIRDVLADVRYEGYMPNELYKHASLVALARLEGVTAKTRHEAYAALTQEPTCHYQRKLGKKMREAITNGETQAALELFTQGARVGTEYAEGLMKQVCREERQSSYIEYKKMLPQEPRPTGLAG